MKLYILLPCYNEQESLPYLLRSIHEMVCSADFDCEVVVIDDGSCDGTVSAAEDWSDRLDIKVIRHDTNVGLGGAVNSGLFYFCSVCGLSDVAVVMDGDNTHNPALIPLMAEMIKYGSDVTIASRYRRGGGEIGLSLLRRLCSASASMLLYLFFRIPNVTDYTCGYRAYTARIIKGAYAAYEDRFIEEKGFTCMTEILIKLNCLGCEFSEVPLVLRYDLKKGRSKMKFVSTIERYFIMMLSSRRYRSYLRPDPALSEGKGK